MNINTNSNPNTFNKKIIETNLNKPCNLKVFDSVTSTNDLMKKENPGFKPTVIVANQQTKGRGRFNRSFQSPAGSGIYLSYGFKPMFPKEIYPNVTPIAAIAAVNSIHEVCKINPKIKWVNDIFYKDKKICGILTESFKPEISLDYAPLSSQKDSLVIGIGINCFPGSFSDDLKEIAGCISPVFNSFSRDLLATQVVNNLNELLSHVGENFLVEEYKSKCFILGRKVKIIDNSEPALAEVLDITSDFALKIKYLSGNKIGCIGVLRAGEISIALEN